MSAYTRGRRTLSAVGVAALGFAALLSAGGAAQAASLDFGNVDTAHPASLTVHKYLHQAGGALGDIGAAPAPGDFTDPVAGVVFTAYPLLKNAAPVDLAVPANWDGLADVVPGPACTAPAGFTLGAPVALPATDAEGFATTVLPVGVYQVCETEAPAQIVDRAIPFIVTLPMPYEKGWLYDVHAYPKNGEGTIEKTITPQQDTGLGSIVTFPVTVPVPTMQQAWTGFAIRDVLDARLTPEPAADMVVTVDGSPLDPSLYSLTVDGQTVTMDFTPAGVAWLNEGPNAHVGARITVEIAAAVTTVGDGVITNQAELWPNNPGFDPSVRPPLPSPVVTTTWGSLLVQKRAAGTTGAEGTLNGAQFEVYDAVDPYAADCSTAQPTGSAISVSGETTFTSAGTGVITVPGLFVSDSVNPSIDAEQRCYVLKEIAAPSGYVLPPVPYTPVAVKAGTTTPADNVEIENTQQEVPPLPMTGAAGQVILITAGVGALGIAVGLLLLKHRRRTREDR